MPVPITATESQLSVAYVRSVVTRAGAALTSVVEEDYGVDGFIHHVYTLPNGKRRASGYVLHFQLKATVQWQIRNDVVVYDMEAEAYNKIVCYDGATCLLLLFCLNHDKTQWVRLNERRLSIRNCCYWTKLNGPETPNERTTRISIPRTQIFSPSAVQDLLQRVKMGAL